jgi:hypothetical protein
MDILQLIVGLSLGVGLAAASGFRVFVPLLVAALAVRSGMVGVAPDWEWIGSWPAIAAFASAAIIEISAYYIPWLDNALDTIATPASVTAGALLTATFLSDFDPMLQWGLAIIVGGGVSGAVQTATVATRAVSTAATAGFGNPVVSTVENSLSVVLALMAVLIPVLTALAALALLVLVVRKLMRWRSARSPQPAI